MNLGFEDFENKSSLLLFDPSSKGNLLFRSLVDYLEDSNSNKSWQQTVKRAMHTFNHKQYQLVYIQPGLMTPKERNSSKIILSQNFRVGPIKQPSDIDISSPSLFNFSCRDSSNSSNNSAYDI